MIHRAATPEKDTMPKFRLPARIAALFALATAHTVAFAQSADPAGSGPINNALLWLQGTLLGTVATTVAVMAVAAIGFMMLTGRMNWRFGATVIIGVFILFGATTIVAGIQSAAG
jgi:type IV secretion system protein VirB2